MESGCNVNVHVRPHGRAFPCVPMMPHSHAFIVNSDALLIQNWRHSPIEPMYGVLVLIFNLVEQKKCNYSTNCDLTGAIEGNSNSDIMHRVITYPEDINPEKHTVIACIVFLLFPSLSVPDVPSFVRSFVMW